MCTHEQLLASKLKAITDGNVNVDVFEIKTCFQNLLNQYVLNGEFDKLFHLFDYIEFFVKEKPHISEKISYDEILQIIGDFFYKIDRNFKALEYYEEAIIVSCENNLIALECYENILNKNIERWHYRMLNDKVDSFFMHYYYYFKFLLIIDEK